MEEWAVTPKKMEHIANWYSQTKYHNLVLRQLHNEMGHLGADRVTSLIRDRFYWPYLQRDIEHYIAQECSCLKDKNPNVPQKAPLKPMITKEPFELVSLDFLHIEKEQKGDTNTL